MPLLSIILTISIWTRAPGNYAAGNDPIKLGLKTVALNSFAPSEYEGMDIQYKRLSRYRGVSLREIVAVVPPVGPADKIILHFENDMSVTVVLDPLTKRPVGDHFVATAIYYEHSWSKLFPSVVKPEDPYRDPVPLRFGGNKLVVAGPEFPWQYVGSLRSIEYVNGAAYDRQFATRGQDVPEDGRQIFLNRCQYCHSVNGLGAKHGPDFLASLPIFEKFGDKGLWEHVRNKQSFRVERGLMMPTQSGFREVEAVALRQWLKAIKVEGPKAYLP